MLKKSPPRAGFFVSAASKMNRSFKNVAGLIDDPEVNPVW